jgi:hypothetical protein
MIDNDKCTSLLKFGKKLLPLKASKCGQQTEKELSIRLLRFTAVNFYRGKIYEIYGRP